MNHEFEGPTRDSKCGRCGILKGAADMFAIQECAVTPTREETLQAERDAATAALADAVRKARDVALEEAATLLKDDCICRPPSYVDPLCYAHDVAERIRALKSKP